MRRVISGVLILLFLFLISFSVGSANALSPAELVILHTNDTHGHPVKFYDYPASDVGGLPARATLIRKVRQTHSNVLLLDAGDLNTGRPESSFFKAEPDIIGYNAIGYDAMVLGNHEFDNPRDVLLSQMEQASFPFLSANVRNSDGNLLTRPYIIKEFSGFKVAIFGLTTTETKAMANPEQTKDLIFEDEVAVAKELVPKLRKQADIVIALVHLGLYDSNERGSRRLASQVQGIDLIVDGHSHTKMEHPFYEGNTPIVQAWQWGLQVGKGVFTIKDGKPEKFSWEPIPINLKKIQKNQDGSKNIVYLGEPITEDQELLNKLLPYIEQAEKSLSEAVGHANDFFSSEKIRVEETALGNLVADALFWFTESQQIDFAIMNSGAIRAGLPPGVLYRKNIYEILPFDNTVVILTIKGSELQELFEYIAKIPPGNGAFPQVSTGVSFTIDHTKDTCTNIRIQNQFLDPDRSYRIATNSFLASGGDGYHVFQKATDSYDTSTFIQEVIIDYIHYLGGKINPEVKGRITIMRSNAETTVHVDKAA